MQNSGGFPLHNTAGERDRVRLEAAVHRLRLENRALRDYLAGIGAVLDVVASPTDEGVIELLGDLVGKALDGADARDGSLLVFDDETQELVFIVVHGAVPEERLKWRRLALGQGIAGWVAQHRQPVIVNDPGADTRFSQLVDEELDFETRSVIATPVEKNGRLLGVFEAINKQRDQDFTEDDAALVLLAARLAAELLDHMARQMEVPEPDPEPAPARPRRKAKRKARKKTARKKAAARPKRATRKSKSEGPDSAPEEAPDGTGTD